MEDFGSLRYLVLFAEREGFEHYMFRLGCMAVSSFGRNCRQPFQIPHTETKKSRENPEFSSFAEREGVSVVTRPVSQLETLVRFAPKVSQLGFESLK